MHCCRVILTAAATIVKAEDNEGHIWALKRIQSDSQSIREAERLVKLRGHPLVVPLQGIFVDHGVTFLQMPFYANGDLRRWVEQIKVQLPCSMCYCHLMAVQHALHLQLPHILNVGSMSSSDCQRRVYAVMHILMHKPGVRQQKLAEHAAAETAAMEHQQVNEHVNARAK